MINNKQSQGSDLQQNNKTTNKKAESFCKSASE